MYTYKNLKYNSYLVVEMASIALAIKMNNFIGIMPSSSLIISNTKSQPY